MLLVFISCGKFSDYNEKEKGLHYKLCSFEDGDIGFRPSFYKVASVTIYSENGLVYKNFKEQIIPARDKRLNKLFEHLAQGDSAMFKISPATLQNMIGVESQYANDDAYYTAEVKVHEYLSSLPKGYDPEMQEQIVLKKYVEYHKIGKPKRGIYVEVLNEGSGKKVKRDKVVTIHYIGRFLNGLEFDNTYKSSSFTFTYGTPGQVIPGLDIALKGMKAGEKAKIIIPSQLAFKEEGSSTGVVPPFTSVEYELEIINVK